MIVSLVVFVVIVVLYMSAQVFAPAHHRIIIFNSANSLNFLKIQDPVRFKGVEAGHIRNVFLRGEKTCVEIETSRPIDIHHGYRIIAEAKGFMGDRYIEVNPGDLFTPLIDPNEPLTGIFPLGPTEAIIYTAELKIKVQALIKLTDELRNGSSVKQSLDDRFTGVIKKVDSISVSLTRLVCKAERFALENADSLAAVMEKADELSKKMSKYLPSAVSTLDSVTVKTRRLLVAADTLAASCMPFLERLNDFEAGALSKDISKLHQQIDSLKDFIVEIREDGLMLPVKF